MGYTGDGSGIAAYAVASDRTMSTITRAQLLTAMQRWGFLEDPRPPPALRWIDTFIEAYRRQACEASTMRLRYVAALRAEACVIPALELERLAHARRCCSFSMPSGSTSTISPNCAACRWRTTFRRSPTSSASPTSDAFAAVRMALTGEKEGPPLELLFPLLGHDRILIRVGAVSSRLLHGRGLEPIKFGPDGEPFETIESKPVDP